MYIPLTFEGALAKCLFASGGLEGYFISGTTQYKYHWFTGSANLVVQKGTIDNVSIAVIGGAGGGAADTTYAGGGGGGGINTTNNGRLFIGNYAIVVGKGGAGAGASGNPGSSGLNSSFVGDNIQMTAFGGEGGNAGNFSRGGTSGNGFLGGLNQSGNGGGGGGATAVGNSATLSKAGDGGAGVIINLMPGFGYGFGCGGGGFAVDTGDDQGFSCNDITYGAGYNGIGPGNNGANYYGMGGGAGYNAGGRGGSGSVIIQYPIYDYCNNYFNETGSCGCREITFDVTDGLNYNPVETGSYLYMPCGEDKFVSGSLFAYAPLTFCAVSNSYYAYTTINEGPDPDVVSVNAGFVTTGRQCISASVTPTTCSVESFAPTCTSSIVTIFTPSASVGNPSTFGYVAKNTTTHSLYSTTSQNVAYFCISTGSLFNQIPIYPKVLTGNFASMISGASCNNVTFTSTAAFPNTRFYRYYNCNGGQVQSSFVGPGSITACIDTSTPYGFTGTTSGTSVTIGGDCLTGSFSTSSCGCP